MRAVGIGFLLILFLIQNATANDFSIKPRLSLENLAFVRYIASLHKRDPFTESGPVAIFIQASLPQLYKQAEMLAVRETGENEKSEYHIVYIGGDRTVVEEVMARSFGLAQLVEDLPLSSILITPANYKFRFRGEVKAGVDKAYVYDITPRKRRLGLIKGQLWMDSATGAEVVVTGRLTGVPSVRGGVDLVRDTKLLGGSAFARVTHIGFRVTHIGFKVPLLGRAEFLITEYRLENSPENPKSGPTDGTVWVPRPRASSQE
jgi:hypothetical protein